MNAIVDSGADWEERGKKRGPRPLGSLGISLALAMAMGLAACQTGEASRDDSAQAAAGYPSLSSVPDASRPSTPIEERRRIVRDLIDERDQSRRQTAVVRTRSGLSVSPAGNRAAMTYRPKTSFPIRPKATTLFV